MAAIWCTAQHHGRQGGAVSNVKAMAGQPAIRPRRAVPPQRGDQTGFASTRNGCAGENQNALLGKTQGGFLFWRWAPANIPRPQTCLGRAAWGGSSAGRALRSQCRGREFDPPPLHQFTLTCFSAQALRAILRRQPQPAFLQRLLLPRFPPQASSDIHSRRRSPSGKWCLWHPATARKSFRKQSRQDIRIASDTARAAGIHPAPRRHSPRAARQPARTAA